MKSLFHDLLLLRVRILKNKETIMTASLVDVFKSYDNMISLVHFLKNLWRVKNGLLVIKK